MDKIRRKVRQVRRRLLWLRFASVTLASLFWLCVAAAVTLLASRLVMLGDNEALWQQRTWWVVGGLVALALPAGVLSLLIRRTSLFQAAVAADQQLSLRERISSAFLLKGPRQPMEQLLEDDALQAATRIRPLRDFPFQPPRTLRLLPLPLLAMLLVGLFVDQHNLLAREERPGLLRSQEDVMALQEDSEQRAEELEQLVSSLEDIEAAIDSEGQWDELQRELEQLAEDLRTVDDSRLEQVAELSDLTDRVAAERDALEQSLAASQHFASDPGAQMTGDIQRAMEAGDMEAAQEAVEELMEDLAKKASEGELDAEQAEQLAQELQAMAEQMGGEGSQTGQQLAQAAQAMAAAAEAMQQAQQAAQQSQQGQQGEQGQQGAQGEGQQSMANEQMQAAMAQMQQAMSDLADAQSQLSIAEALEQDLNAMRANLSRDPNQQNQQPPQPGQCQTCGSSQCQGGQCSGIGQGRVWSLSQRTGEWRPGETLNRQGNGMGGPGQGRGGRAPMGDASDATFRDEHLQSQHSPGVIIAEFRHDDGVQLPGESNVEVRDVFLTYEQQAEQTLQTEAIPAGYRNIVGDYFTSIHPAAPQRSGDQPAPADAEPSN
jgi:hypothetical protein